MTTIGTPEIWAGFALLILVALAVDFLVLRHGGAHKVSFGEALGWSVGWVALALAFNAALWWYLHGQSGSEVADRVALEFLTGYLVEKALAVDNLFVFLMLFTYFSVPAEQQQRVLILGVLGAIVLRAIMIFAGALLIARFHWLLYGFGLFLLVTGIKMLVAAGHAPDLERNPVLVWMRNHLPLTEVFHGNRLVVREDGLRRYTPLFVVAVLIAVTDVIFAVDSIPAIFAITTDSFVVLSSNVFAVLGLRALYFLLAGMAERFHLLVYGLAAVLIFIGTKMLIAGVFHIPVVLSLLVVAGLITVSVVASLMIPPPREPRAIV